jgi:hypothetical protein
LLTSLATAEPVRRDELEAFRHDREHRITSAQNWTRRISFSDPIGTRYHGTDNFAGGVNSRQSTILDFKAATVVTTYL